MKIVLDTNVLVSAFIKPQSNAARILRLVLQGDVHIIVNECILTEYYEVLARPKFDLKFDKVQTILELIRSKSIKAPALAKSFHLPDCSDEPFLEAALEILPPADLGFHKIAIPFAIWSSKKFPKRRSKTLSQVYILCYKHSCGRITSPGVLSGSRQDVL